MTQFVDQMDERMEIFASTRLQHVKVHAHCESRKRDNVIRANHKVFVNVLSIRLSWTSAVNESWVGIPLFLNMEKHQHIKKCS